MRGGHISLVSSNLFCIMRYFRILFIVFWRIIFIFRIFSHHLKFVFHLKILESPRHSIKLNLRLVANLDIGWMPLLLVWLEDWVFQWGLGYTWSLSLYDISFYWTWCLRWLYQILMLIPISKIDRHICIIFLLLIPHFYKRALLLAVFLGTLRPTYITRLLLRHSRRLN